jgi:hypothetical protein
VQKKTKIDEEMMSINVMLESLASFFGRVWNQVMQNMAFLLAFCVASAFCSFFIYLVYICGIFCGYSGG